MPLYSMHICINLNLELSSLLLPLDLSWPFCLCGLDVKLSVKTLGSAATDLAEVGQKRILQTLQ